MSTNGKIFLFGGLMMTMLFGSYLIQAKETAAKNQSIRPIPNDANYYNSEFGYWLNIPKGFTASERDNITYIYKSPTTADGTPLPEMTIAVSVDTPQNRGTDWLGIKILDKKSITINNSTGTLFTIEHINYPQPNTCPSYRFIKNDKIYDVDLYECLESSVFEGIVQSIDID